MALVSVMLTFVALCVFSLAAAAFGNSLLRLLQVEMETDLQHLLVAIGLGVSLTETLLFAVQDSGHFRLGCFAVMGLLCVFLTLEVGAVSRRGLAVLRAIFQHSRDCRLPVISIVVVGLIEFLMALAPLVGSDALHYHFTTQKLIIEQAFHPLFSISHSFLSGQHHLLIFLGLILGSEKLALGFIFLGGVLTALSLACMSSRGASGFVSASVTLLFLLTPVIFWQITSSGTPDIWMAFFTNTTVLVLSRGKAYSTWRQVLLAGLLAGGIAGARYTGCVMAAGLAICVAIEFRSALKTGLFCAGSLITGVWPYLRNSLWTGDPVFPFLLKRLFPERVNAYGLANLLADTGATQARQYGELFPFVFFAGMRQDSPGLWDFFGPIILALAPLTLLAIKNVREWRVPVIVWFFSAPVVFFTSGLQRFLLPIFPLALVCVAWGIEDAKRKEWKLTRSFAIASIVLMWVVGGPVWRYTAASPSR